MPEKGEQPASQTRVPLRDLKRFAVLQRQQPMQVVCPVRLFEMGRDVMQAIAAVHATSRIIEQPAQTRRESAPGFQIAIGDAGVRLASGVAQFLYKPSVLVKQFVSINSAMKKSRRLVW